MLRPVRSGLLSSVCLVGAGLLVGGGVIVLGAGDAVPWVLGAGLAIVASGLAMQRLVGVFGLGRMSIPGFWYLTYLAMIVLPAFVVADDHPGPAARVFLLAVLSALATVPLGVAAVSFIARCGPAEIARYLQRPVSAKGIDSSVFAVWLVGLLITATLGLWHIGRLEAIPVVEMIRRPGDAHELSLLREESLKLLDRPSAYVLGLLRAVGFPFLVAVAVGGYLLTRERRWRAGAMVSALLGVAYASVSIARGPVAEIIVVSALCVYLLRLGRVKPRGWLGVVVLALAFPIAVNMLKYGADLVEAAHWFGMRLFYTPAWVLYLYFETFSGGLGMLGGRSIGALSWLMGWDHFDTANYVGIYAAGSSLASVSANAAFIGNLYADFGILGVLVGGVATGAILQGVQVLLVRRGKDAVNVASYSYLLVGFWKLHSSALPVVLVSHGVLLAAFLPWLVNAAALVLRTTTRGVGARAFSTRRPGVPELTRGARR